MRRMLSFGMATLGLVVLATGSAGAGPSLLFDAKTGQVIESEDAFARWYPASLTKLMTTYAAFRAVEAGEVTLQSPVRVSRNAANEPPSKMGYPVGTVLTLDNALKIIMVKSANDVATSIGESLAGSEEAWAVRMNAESKRLGMSGSHWVNAHGLHDDQQYTTARDLGVLAAALRREFPQYASYFSIDGLSNGKQVIPSHNKLLGRFEGADGMKTGYTCPAGYNLVASATRDGRTLMAIVIGATSVKSRNEAAAGLLAKGFSQPIAGGATLAAMKPSGPGIGQATNMREALCTKAGSTALRKREREAAARRKKEGSIRQSRSLYRPSCRTCTLCKSALDLAGLSRMLAGGLLAPGQHTIPPSPGLLNVPAHPASSGRTRGISAVILIAWSSSLMSMRGAAAGTDRRAGCRNRRATGFLVPWNAPCGVDQAPACTWRRGVSPMLRFAPQGCGGMPRRRTSIHPLLQRPPEALRT